MASDLLQHSPEREYLHPIFFKTELMMLPAKTAQCHSQMKLAKSTWHVGCMVHINDKYLTIFPMAIFLPKSLLILGFSVTSLSVFRELPGAANNNTEKGSSQRPAQFRSQDFTKAAAC